MQVSRFNPGARMSDIFSVVISEADAEFSNKREYLELLFPEWRPGVVANTVLRTGVHVFHFDNGTQYYTVPWKVWDELQEEDRDQFLLSLLRWSTT